MKTLKALSLSLLAAVALTSTASATATTIHVAGSTAYRGPVAATIIDYLVANPSSANHVYAGYTGSSLLGANSLIAANGTIGSGGTATIIIEAYWTGSLAGVVDLVAQVTTNASGTGYIDPANMGSTAITAVNGSSVTTSPYGGGVSISPTAYATSFPTVVMSDSVASSIQAELATANPLTGSIGSYSTLKSLITGINNVVDAGTGSALSAKTVGVVPFEWVVGNIQTSTDIPTNIDQQTAHSLIANGYVAQSQLTGGISSADVNNYFYFTGRNEDSGTRISYLSESQNGVANGAVQYALNADSTTPTGTLVANAYQYPAVALNTEPNITWNTVGHSGYAGGADVAGALAIQETNTPYVFSDGSQALGQNVANGGTAAASYFISSLGIGDAVKANNGKAAKVAQPGQTVGTPPFAHLLSYNGVPFSVQAVENGQYTHWTYEHCYHLSTDPNSGFSNYLANRLYSTNADLDGGGLHAQSDSNGILYTNMNVSRDYTEGGPILHN